MEALPIPSVCFGMTPLVLVGAGVAAHSERDALATGLFRGSFGLWFTGTMVAIAEGTLASHAADPMWCLQAGLVAASALWFVAWRLVSSKETA